MKSENVYVIKITLDATDPPIWRRIEVPEKYTLWDLHVALQSSMGWLDSHLHAFYVKNENGDMDAYGTPTEDIMNDIKPDWKYKMKRFLNKKNKEVQYMYDFGDSWEHIILLEEVKPADPDRVYPVCTDGAGKCPPEDVGGVSGYEHFVEIMKDANHKKHKNMSAWYGGEYDPEHFDISDIKFLDPVKRFNEVFNEDEDIL